MLLPSATCSCRAGKSKKQQTACSVHTHAGAAGVSSAHVTFNTAEEAAALEELGFLTRCGIQFHWENAGYKSWADFEAALKQPKRKSIRQVGWSESSSMSRDIYASR